MLPENEQIHQAQFNDLATKIEQIRIDRDNYLNKIMIHTKQ